MVVPSRSAVEFDFVSKLRTGVVALADRPIINVRAVLLVSACVD